MRKADVQYGFVYRVKVSGNLANVRITRSCPYGGWFGLNLATGREVRVKTAARLRFEVHPDAPVPARPEKRCETCRFWVERYGSLWCSRLDWSAERPTVCSAWEAK